MVSAFDLSLKSCQEGFLHKTHFGAVHDSGVADGGLGVDRWEGVVAVCTLFGAS